MTKKNRTLRRLQIRRQTLRNLSDGELGQVAGGTLTYYGTIAYTSGTYTRISAPPPPPTTSSATVSYP